MTASIATCLLAFATLVWLLRRDRVSLGLPVAYLFLLLLLHVPGAVAHAVGGDVLHDSDLTALGIRFTAIASVCFVAGVWLGRLGDGPHLAPAAAPRHQFALFCLAGGWLVTYGFSYLGRIPSLGAALEKSGAVWILAVLLGLRAALGQSWPKAAVLWILALAVYPVLMLLIGGFLSYGSSAIIIALAALTVSTRNTLRMAIATAIVSVVGLNLFISYFQNRDDIREAVWGRAPLERRVDVSLNVFRDFEWFNPANDAHLISLDERLNQNYFAGLAATRINEGQVDYLHGRSVWEAGLSLIPRALWPGKTVFGGSPKIVSEMTGLTLSETTAFGVGNVMEFQINFGVTGIVVGFLLLGWGLGFVDRRAAIAEINGEHGRLFLFFLPGAAMIQPGNSLVELTGGTAAALVAAFAWKVTWEQWSARQLESARPGRHYAGGGR